MRGHFRIKKVSKKTGETEVIYEDSNMVTTGFSLGMTDILSNVGSTDINDFQLRYFQLGEDSYNLSSYDVSTDIPEERLRKHVWSLKDPMALLDYGRDSVIAVTTKNVYGVGSIVPLHRTKVFDNFIDPPEDTKISVDYSNNFRTYDDGMNESIRYTPSSIWIANDPVFSSDKNNFGIWPLSSTVDITASGPSYVPPTYKFSYTANRNVSGIVKSSITTNPKYVYSDNTTHPIWNSIRENQTHSIYISPTYYLSSLSTSSSTPLTSELQLFNKISSGVIGDSIAGENRATFRYRYDMDNIDRWYPPAVLSGSTGFEECVAKDVSCFNRWESIYGVGVSGGTLSANVECSAGEMYTYEDHPTYATRSGPGADCYDTSNSGFGPSGQFYRISASLVGVPNSIFYPSSGNFSGTDCVPKIFPMVSSVSGIVGGELVGNTNHQVTPREEVYIANYQFEYSTSASPYQTIHAEKPYYITSAQDVLSIPNGYTTSLHDNTFTVRLLIDEELANDKTIKEVGLFMKNPKGSTGRDEPMMVAYKKVDPPINKNNEFSYIIDWELSVIDIN